jgi:outer membrane protein TolC
MKLKSISIIVSLGLVLVFMNALPLAVNAQGEATLTLDQAIAAALKNDFQVVTARNNLEKAKLTVRKEILNIYPQAVINDSLGRDLGNGDSANTLTITIKETLPTKFNLYGAKVPTSIETALWDQLSSEMQLKITAANTTNTVISNYLNLLKAQKNLKQQ